jgi:hypothetical protein
MNPANKMTCFRRLTSRVQLNFHMLGGTARVQGRAYRRGECRCFFRQNIGGAFVDEIAVFDAEQIGEPVIDTLEALVAIDKGEANRGIIVESVKFELRVRHCTVAVDRQTPNAGSA